MSKSVHFFAGLLVVALMAAGVTASAAMAQDQAKDRKAARVEKESTKVLFDNDQVRVQEVTFKPGDQGPNAARPFRIIRVLKGGTIRRTFSDGKIDNVVYKTGEVKVYEADRPFVPKNIGKSDIVLYVVALKDHKN
jgi:quercetin dioxygenase-like cupin family protein